MSFEQVLVVLRTVGVDELCNMGSDVVTEDKVYGYCLWKQSRVSADQSWAHNIHGYLRAHTVAASNRPDIMSLATRLFSAILNAGMSLRQVGREMTAAGSIQCWRIFGRRGGRRWSQTRTRGRVQLKRYTETGGANATKRTACTGQQQNG